MRRGLEGIEKWGPREVRDGAGLSPLLSPLWGWAGLRVFFFLDIGGKSESSYSWTTARRLRYGRVQKMSC